MFPIMAIKRNKEDRNIDLVESTLMKNKTVITMSSNSKEIEILTKKLMKIRTMAIIITTGTEAINSITMMRSSIERLKATFRSRRVGRENLTATTAKCGRTHIRNGSQPSKNK
jgi:hypothetical protein